ncbi:MAG TPA: NUDIX domain-containing protein [Bacteroidales bacterium]|jgi:8-oxo-dGTP diphosphatase|nr:NUDIX hydrolase [Bacteroidales bacterium]HPY67606.1 NUDIX domain-containing protein [Bacteroidales bacterium]HQB37222.1 NUDIX domain-containing protein [Bacteroidales bacterium]
MQLYSKHSKHLVAVDCIIFGYDLIEKDIKLLLVRRNFEPAKGKWSLAGGFVKPDESLDEAACRVLCNLTGLQDIYMKQLYSYGDPERDPGARVISVAYYALIKIKDIDKELAVSSEAHWQSLHKVPKLIFDHSSMVERALKDLAVQARIKPVGFELLPSKFTLVQLLDLYSAIYRKQIDKRNFRKKILSMDILEKLDEKEKETSKKGAYYYRFIKSRYNKFIKNGSYFNLDVG